MEAPLSGILTIAIVIAMVCAAWGMFALELSLLAALGLYSLSGTLALLFLVPGASGMLIGTAVLVTDLDLAQGKDWIDLFPFLSTRRPDTYAALAEPVRPEHVRVDPNA